MQDMDEPKPLGTASEDVYIDKAADCVMGDGMNLKGAWMAPWMDKTLVSLSNRMRQGYTMVAHGSYAYLISPMHDVYKYVMCT